jgi:hypothetical protein
VLWTVAVVMVVGAAAFDVVNRAAGAGDPCLPSIAAAALGFGTVRCWPGSRYSSPPSVTCCATAPRRPRRLLDGQAQGAVSDVRRLVDDLRPPALDELGLASAIREQAARFAGTLAVSVDVNGTLGDLPAAVEVAAARPSRSWRHYCRGRRGQIILTAAIGRADTVTVRVRVMRDMTQHPQSGSATASPAARGSGTATAALADFC